VIAPRSLQGPPIGLGMILDCRYQGLPLVEAGSSGSVYDLAILRSCILLWTFQGCCDTFATTKGVIVSADKSEVLQGTLDMMILKTLHVLGPLHGFGIARRIEQVSEDVLTLNEGTVYTSLLRLQQQGWIESEWGTSENNRRSRFYSITRRGRKQLAVEMENWDRISGVIGRVLALQKQS
jgi:PadR family transcriptional regulator PadR